MGDHNFLLEPKFWLGEGIIQLNMVEEELGFYTRWNISNANDAGEIECIQEIQIKGISDLMHNKFLISSVSNSQFIVQLENEAIGKVVGSGILSDKIIAWEFRAKEIGFEGFEMYEKQEDGSYLMRAEFSTGDQFRTTIRGRVWQRI